jgi:hypothetical protein
MCGGLFEKANNPMNGNCAKCTLWNKAICLTLARAALYECWAACLEPWSNSKPDDPDAGKAAFTKYFNDNKPDCATKVDDK